MTTIDRVLCITAEVKSWHQSEVVRVAIETIETLIRMELGNSVETPLNSFESKKDSCI